MYNHQQAAWRGMRHPRYMDETWRHMSWRRPKYNVPMNVIETDTLFEIHLYATGFAKEDVKIRLDNDMLHVRGTRTIDESKSPKFIIQEYPIKNFERVISLKSKVDRANITARQVDNVLVITLPKSGESQHEGQEIPVV